MKKIILTFFTTILVILTVQFLLIYKNRLSLTYNSEGNFFNESSATVYHEHEVLVYGLITLFLFILTLIFTILTLKNYKKI